MRPRSGFHRARHVRATIGILLAFGAILRLLGEVRFTLPRGSGASLPFAAFMPLFAACVVAVSQHSLFGELENMASRNLRWHRLRHLLALTIFSSIVIWIAAAPVQGPTGPISAVRNFLLLLGVALALSPVSGARLSWAAPTILTFVLTTLAAGLLVPGPSWNLLLQFDENRSAFTISLVVLTAGVLVASGDSLPVRISDRNI